jgi:hypothetical protein
MKAISGRDINRLKTGEGWRERPREPTFQIQTSKPGLIADIPGQRMSRSVWSAPALAALSSGRKTWKGG